MPVQGYARAIRPTKSSTYSCQSIRVHLSSPRQLNSVLWRRFRVTKLPSKRAIPVTCNSVANHGIDGGCLDSVRYGARMEMRRCCAATPWKHSSAERKSSAVRTTLVDTIVLLQYCNHSGTYKRFIVLFLTCRTSLKCCAN